MIAILTVSVIPIILSCLLYVHAQENINSSTSSSEDLNSENNVSTAIISNGNFTTLVKYENISGLPIAEGDIIIDKSAPFLGEAAMEIYTYNNYWENGIIPYKIDNKVESKYVQIIEKAIDQWKKNVPILNFIEINEFNEFEYPDYVLFKRFNPSPGYENVACASNVGRQTAGGEQVIAIFPNCDFGNMLHEIGHLVGLWHEHSRSDRDVYIQINDKNIIAEKGFILEFKQERCDDFGLNCVYPDDVTSYYDYCSIMHYSRYAFSIMPGYIETITPNPKFPIVGCDDIGQRQQLSKGDVEAVNKKYKEIFGNNINN